jgi:hypothetical protein
MSSEAASAIAKSFLLTPTRIQGIASYYIFFNGVVLLLTVIETMLYCCHKLKHFTYLCFQIAKSLIMLFLLVRAIVGAALAPPNHGSSVVVVVILLVIFLYCEPYLEIKS